MNERKIGLWAEDLGRGQTDCKLPPYVYHAIRAWVLERRPPGDFVQACLRNDFADAVLRADDTNICRLRSIAEFLSNYVPMACWGSAAKTKAWREGEDDET